MLSQTVKKVLLVDDSSTVLAIHRAILEDAGFQCESAESGIEAYEMIARDRFDLVVTDLNMPKMDGYELVKKLRDSKQMIPIIMVTTEQEDKDRARGIDAGVDLFVVKPVDPDDFVQQCQLLAG